MSDPGIAALRARMPRAFGPAPRTLALRGVGALLFLAWLVALCRWFDVTPARLVNGLSGLWSILRLMAPPSPGEQWADILRGLGESVAMAFLATVLASVAAVPLGMLGARNVMVNALAHFSLRRVLDGVRGVDQLIWALAYVRAVGLGPLAGVLALFTAEVALLAKVYAEAVENADPRQREGIEAAGGSRLQALRFGVLPQVLSGFASYTLLRFEINVREATVMGFVGAGGIGEELLIAIRRFYYSDRCLIIHPRRP